MYIYDFFYVIAMFTKVILGFFQVQGMAELGYRIMNQHQKIKYLQVVIAVINISAFICMSLLATDFMFIIRAQVKSTLPYDPTPFYEYMSMLGYTSGTYYTLLTIFLVYYYKKLDSALKSKLCGTYSDSALFV